MKIVRLALLFVLLFAGSAGLSGAEPPEIVSLRAKAERGNSIAEYNLGLAYAQGRLVPVDLAEAYVWLSLASETGSTGKALEALLGAISNPQLAEGRRRLETLRATNPYLKPPAVRRAAAAGSTAAAGPAGPGGPGGKSSEAEAPRGAASADPIREVGAKSDEAKHLYEQLNTVTGEKKQLADALAEARKEAARLQSELAALRAKAIAPDPAQKLATELDDVRRELAAAKAKAATAENATKADACAPRATPPRKPRRWQAPPNHASTSCASATRSRKSRSNITAAPTAGARSTPSTTPC